MQPKIDTLLSAEEITDLTRIMTIKYSSQLNGRFFAIETKSDHQLAFATTTLKNSDGSFCYPVEGRMAHKEQNTSPRDAQLFLIDYLDQYFSEYFHNDENVFVTIDWCTYRCEDLDLQMRGQLINQKVQALADALLAPTGVSE